METPRDRTVEEKHIVPLMPALPASRRRRSRSPLDVRSPDSADSPSISDGRGRRPRRRRRASALSADRVKDVQPSDRTPATSLSPNYVVGRLTAKQRMVLEELGCTDFRDGVGVSHPILAWCRRMAEHLAFLKASKMTMFGDTVLDWSGSAIRHDVFARPVHSTRPEITPEDSIANREAIAKGVNQGSLAGLCKCYIDQECHMCAAKEVSMSVDVLYYYSPVQIASAMLRTTTRTHVAVVHAFADSCLYDEAICRYRFEDGREWVSLNVRGNGEFDHPVPQWIYDGGVQVVAKGPDGLSDYWLVATLHREVGPMLVIVLTLHPREVRFRPLHRTRTSKLWDRDGKPEALMRTIAMTHRVGPSAVTLRQFKSRLEILAVQAGYDITHELFTDWQSSEFFLEESAKYVGVVAWLTTKFGFSNIESAEKLVSGDLSWRSWFYAYWQRRPSWLLPLLGGLALGAGLVFSRKRPALSGPLALLLAGPLAIATTCVGDSDHPKAKDTKYLDNGIPTRCMPKFGARQVGFYFPFSQPAIMASCVHNQKSAVLLRAINPTMDVDGNAWREASSFLAQIPVLDVQVDRGEWLAKYPGARRAQLIEAIHQVDCFGLLRSDYHKSRGFVKREFYLEKEKDKPRLIQARTDPYLVELGPWVWAYQKSLGAVFNHTNDLFYVCGSSAEEIGQWVMDCQGMHLYECDHSTFDSSVSLEALNFEFSCYKKSNPPSDVWGLLLGQLHTVGSTSGGVRYTFRGRRNSGVPNTSVGNSLINLAALRYAFGGCRVRIMVLGDDSVIACDRVVDVPKVVDRLSSLGFKSKLVYRPIMYDLEFCSALFWPTADGLVLGPKPGRVLAKSYWDKVARSEGKHRAWLRGVFASQERDTAFVPVLNKCIRFGLLALGEGPVMVKDVDHRIHAKETHKPTSETYAMFKYRYGMGPEALEPTGWALRGYNWETLSLVDNGSNPHDERVQGLTLSILDHPSVLQSQLYTVLAAPVIEETVKRAISPSWWSGALFGLVEGLLYGDMPFRVVAHTVLSLMPMPAAIAAHLAWNAYALASGTTKSDNTQQQPTLNMAQGKKKQPKKTVVVRQQRAVAPRAPTPHATQASGRQTRNRTMSSKANHGLVKEISDYLKLSVNPSLPLTARIPDDSNAASTAIKVVTRFTTLIGGGAHIVVSPATPYRLYSVTSGAMSEPVNPITPCANYDGLAALFERVRVVSASVEIVQNYAAAQAPGIGFCTAVPAGAPLMTSAQLQTATTVHVEPMFNGCYMRYTQSVNPVTGRGQYIDLETPDQFLDRMQMSVLGASDGLKYEVIITCNYELISSPLGLGAAFASKPPVAKQAAEAVQGIVGKLPTNATRDYVLENKATSSLGSKLLDAAGDVAAGLIDSVLPKPLAGLAKGLGAAIAQLF